MISGWINEHREIVFVVQVSNIANRALTAHVEVVLDTGFSEELVLPPDIVSTLGLTPQGEMPLTLADGEEQIFDFYMALISWHGQDRIVAVIEMPSERLIGMNLLWGSRLIVDAAVGGEAIIEPLTSTH